MKYQSRQSKDQEGEIFVKISITKLTGFLHWKHMNLLQAGHCSFLMFGSLSLMNPDLQASY